jgi:TolB protein
LQMLTDGTGEAAQPAWHPDGHHIAFTWTRGYERGGYNIFIMDLAQPASYVQLTHGNGANENPSWAPDGIHIVFSNERGRVKQIYTMTAQGRQVKQLTSQGNNWQPVWANKIN